MFNRDDNGGARNYGGPRNDYTGEWECSECHAKTPHSLPFKPTGDRKVFCKTCYRANKPDFRR
ncbi:MAG: hypothetical protein HYW79_02510 [Parcubacteria group bacterium]|nr:hypothetical protein [Parcubacteria group bacterium]